MFERATVRLLWDLLARAKRKAAAEGRTLASLIAGGLRPMIAENRKGGAGRRLPPPVCTATGGLMPGIDIANSSALQEMDDLEHVERMKRLK